MPTITTKAPSASKPSLANVPASIASIWSLFDGFTTIADPGDEGTLTATTSGICNITSAAADDVMTLDVPSFNGQILCIWVTSDSGATVITYAAGFDEAGNNTWTTADDGDFMCLVAVDDGGTLKWRIWAGGLAAGIFSELSTV